VFRAPWHYRFACRVLLAAACAVLIAPSARGQLRPNAAALAAAPPEVLDRLRANPFTYFRFINRAWIARVCEKFADVPDMPIVRLHGDAHVEQFALTKDAWGLDDFDDSARGPEFVDIVRFLGSVDLATRQRGWTQDRDALWDRFLEGYRRGLSDPSYRAPEPDIVRQLRAQMPTTRAAFLAWGESRMQPMDEDISKSVLAGMEAFERSIRSERPDFAPGYFAVVRAGWLNIGVGSSVLRKVLIRVQGPTSDPDDDLLLEAKEAADLDGLSCLEGPMKAPAIRIIDGTLQLARLKHDILAVGPTLLIPAAPGRGELWLKWWVSSWEPSYREIRLSDLRSSQDLADIVFDSGIQLGAGEPQEPIRKQELSSLTRLDARLRKETSAIVEELFAGWREVGGK
jgi:Uncharacterized protein conserved in bacteria (DUF2252)